MNFTLYFEAADSGYTAYMFNFVNGKMNWAEEGESGVIDETAGCGWRSSGLGIPGLKSRPATQSPRRGGEMAEQVQWRAKCGVCGFESSVFDRREDAEGEVSRCRSCGSEGRYTVECRDWHWAGSCYNRKSRAGV